MGGVGTWKESARQRLKRMQMWEDDEFSAGADGERDAEREETGDAFDDYDEGGSGQKEGDEEEVSILILDAFINYDLADWVYRHLLWT